jgi:MFS family permease
MRSLPYIVQLAALVLVGALVWPTQETVPSPVKHWADVHLRPRLGVPRQIRGAFVPPAVTVFGTMALIGFFAALIPSLLAERLHQTNHATGGAVVFWLLAVAVAAVILSRRVASHRAMLAALVMLLPSLALLVLAQILRSMPILVLGTTLSGAASALGYRGSLAVINTIAPEERRAEVVSTYLVSGFIGNSLPIIGVGALSAWLGSVWAGTIFAGTIGAFALVAILAGVKQALRPS